MFVSILTFTQSVGAVEYIDSSFAEGEDSLNECPGYDTKQADGEVPVMLEVWGMRTTLHCHRRPVQSGREF